MAQIISIPIKKPKKNRVARSSDVKYFSKKQIQLLRRTVREQAVLDEKMKRITGIREWLAIDILTSSGLRVSECAGLRCGDLRCGYGESALFVRDGKCSKSRTVEIPKSLKTHFTAFLKWKERRGEPTGHDDPLFIGKGGRQWTCQAVQILVRKYLMRLDLYESGKNVHALRHSYAVELYRREKDLRAVQKQLGHASIQNTQIYADCLREDIAEQIKGLWN